jgi:hypothetical protein
LLDDGAGAGGVELAGALAGGVVGFAGAAGAVFVVCSRIELLPVLTSVGVRLIESVSEVSMNTMAHHVVAFDRNVAAPRGPKAVWLPAPPNAPARSAALPLCSMITRTSTMQTRTCSVTKRGVYFHPAYSSPAATRKEIPHFTSIGIPSDIHYSCAAWPLEILA